MVLQTILLAQVADDDDDDDVRTQPIRPLKRPPQGEESDLSETRKILIGSAIGCEMNLHVQYKPIP